MSGLKIYEAIVENRVVDTSIAQLKSMNESLDVMGTTAEPIAAAKPSANAKEPALKSKSKCLQSHWQNQTKSNQSLWLK